MKYNAVFQGFSAIDHHIFSNTTTNALFILFHK